jgi:RimJ/RimL family protein N-acetyltransferase
MVRRRLGWFRQVSTTTAAVTADWRERLPPLSAKGVALRELQIEDAAALLAHLTTRDVDRFISPAPKTIEGFERFITWTHSERAAGRYACYGVVPQGMSEVIGLFQVRQLLPSFEVAEWGFALAQPFWGTGVFTAAALSVIEFATTRIGVRRLEARASVFNARGNGALKKIGAVREAVLRKSILKDGGYHDQVLWAITAEDAAWTTPNPSRLLH